MGLLASAFNMVARLHSRPVTIKRPGSSSIASLYSSARATPSNYFRYASGPAETVVTGSEFIIPLSTITGTQIQTLAFDHVPTAGEWKLIYNSISTANFNFNADANGVQSSLRLVTGLGQVVVTGNYTDGFAFTMFGVQAPLLLMATDGGSPLDAVMSIAVAPNGAMPVPLIARGDKIIDAGKSSTIKEIIEMPDLGGDVMGYRVRVDG